MPDNYNYKRASWAEVAVQAFEDTTRTEREDALCDLLADLMHWADREGVDFNEELARATRHYETEVSEDSKCKPQGKKR